MNLHDEMQAVDAVQRAADRVHRRGRFGDFELSNGIILGLKPVAPLLLNAVQEEFTPPDPPKVYMEEKGRDEPNPNDPAYLAEVERLSNEQSMAVNNMLLAAGTVCKSVPEGYFAPEDEGWIEQIAMAGEVTGRPIEIHTDQKIKRYLCWLRYYALETNADIAILTSLIIQLGGITEGEVESAIESFRRLPERGPDTSSEIEAGNQNGNSANRASRRRSSRA